MTGNIMGEDGGAADLLMDRDDLHLMD